MICPKCGFEQTADVECARCGVVFEKYRARSGSLAARAWMREALNFLVGALFVGLGATAAAVAYYRLRMVKEGVSATEIVSVFD